MYQATVKRIAKEDLLSLSRKEHDTVLANCSAMTNHRFASAYDSVIPRRTDDGIYRFSVLIRQPNR